MENIRVGIVGLGCRGSMILEGLLLGMEGLKITRVCDTYEDRVNKEIAAVEKIKGYRPLGTTDWHDLITCGDVDAILVLSSWENHVPVCLAAMEAHIPVATEVGGAYSLDDCWQLVRTQERTGSHFMFLENCCYGREEMLVMNMIKEGLFGQIVHCEGGYAHDLRTEVLFGRENRHYRLRNYIGRNCENYPTHELGPIAKILHINRGNRMLNLVSMASCAHGLNDYAQTHSDVDPALRTQRFAQGDIVSTLIRCANGESIAITLDTTLPRPYSRHFTVRGTRGMYNEDNSSIYLDRDHNESMHFNWQPQWNNVQNYFTDYEHPLWNQFLHDGVKGGHGGMDYLVYDAFFASVRNGTPAPIDVYDAAVWMAVTPLSEASIAAGSAPVDFPDFTSGRWLAREDSADAGIYTLDY